MTFGRSLAFIAGVAILVAAPVMLASNWQPLQKDGLHDPNNPGLELLQQPHDALSALPPDTAGNMVDWVQAVRQGKIQPRTSLDGSRVPETRETVIVMRNTLMMLPVSFPHKAHTEWMDCVMCHESIFLSEVDANPMSMARILEGKDCGVCHGAVSFPLTECDRCHNVQQAPNEQKVESGAWVKKE